MGLLGHSVSSLLPYNMNPESHQSIDSKIEVMADLETTVGILMAEHEAKRDLWWPSDLIGTEEDGDPHVAEVLLQEHAQGLSDPCRVAIALNLITEEGLPHFHRILAVHFGDDTFWRQWMNLWTAEEDRHGVVLHDYCRITRILQAQGLDRLQFEYLRSGFHPHWDYDPYRTFVYTTLQERATQWSHSNTGKACADYEPRIHYILGRIAGDEARHYAFYRQVFAEILQRDPDAALESAAAVMPSIEMPGASMPDFREYADVVRRSGIYGPRDYQHIVKEQIKFWKIEKLSGLKPKGCAAQEQILSIPQRLERVAEHFDRRAKSKTFSFDLVWHRTFEMDP